MYQHTKKYVLFTALMLFSFTGNVFCQTDLTDKNDEIVTLWSGGEYPNEDEFHRLSGVRFGQVKPRVPEKDSFVWQHGAAIIRFKGKLYVSLGANAGHENTVGEKILMTTSDDGIHWSPCQIIGDPTDDNVGHSHGVFLEHDGKLWAFHARFVKKGTPGAIGNAFPGLAMEAFLLNESTGHWESHGIVAQGIWPLHEPIKLDNGNWIVAGCDEDWRAAVAVSEGDNLTKWNTIKIRNGNNVFTEANLWVKGNRLVLLIRNDAPSRKDDNRAAVAVSNDFGQTWTIPVESDMPMTSSKPACGVLSTGERFLINNLVKPGNNRRYLCIAVGRPGEETLSKIWMIRDVQEPVPVGAFPAGSFAYPHAAEYDGKLYVVYSVGAVDGTAGNHNHIELAIIPISELDTD